MYPFIPCSALADELAVGASSAPFAALTALVSGITYAFVSSTNCWLRQGSAWLLTAVAKASCAAGDYFTITVDGVDTVYQLNVSGTDSVKVVGAIQVDISAATDAESVVDLLVTAITAHQASLVLTDNDDGTLTIVQSGVRITLTEHVADAGFLVAATTLVASAAAGNMFIPLGTFMLLDGRFGAKVSVIRDTASGASTLVPVKL